MSRILITIGLLIFVISLPVAVLFALPAKKQVSYSQTSNDPNPDKLFYLINNYREQNNLPLFEKNDELCRIAGERSQSNLDNHKGFLERYSSSPYRLSENMTDDINPYGAFNGWMKSPSHNAAMLSDMKYACVACNKTCVTIFSSFTR